MDVHVLESENGSAFFHLLYAGESLVVGESCNVDSKKTKQNVGLDDHTHTESRKAWDMQQKRENIAFTVWLVEEKMKEKKRKEKKRKEKKGFFFFRFGT